MTPEVNDVFILFAVYVVSCGLLIWIASKILP